MWINCDFFILNLVLMLFINTLISSLLTFSGLFLKSFVRNLYLPHCGHSTTLSIKLVRHLCGSNGTSYLFLNQLCTQNVASLIFSIHFVRNFKLCISRQLAVGWIYSSHFICNNIIINYQIYNFLEIFIV